VKLFATKNVLTEGIREVEADDDVVAGITANELIPAKRNVMAIDRSSGRDVQLWLDGENREWHRTREGAVRRAIHARNERVVSLQKQIARLDAMQFE
jgi:hypothetical protein